MTFKELVWLKQRRKTLLKKLAHERSDVFIKMGKENLIKLDAQIRNGKADLKLKIETVEDDLRRNMLEYYYLDDADIIAMQDRFHYADSYCYRLMKEAIQAIETGT